ncbi:larval cuticle protein 65Ag1-like [Chironomus tepperi]|uniref:larval cuticle protein 65Ag1-like n=1 Tax=Chironomus tepperi TaxID=113505 RepID=UPI00391F6606
MKYIIVAVVLLSGVLSAPAPQESSPASQVVSAAATIVRYFFDWYPNNEGYRYTYELSDGQIRSEEGKYKDGVDIDGNPVKILVVQGAYSHVGPDGETYWVNYQSDENGYKPKTGKGVGGIKPGEDASIDPNLLKSLIG